MRILSRLPDDMVTELRRLDPMTDRVLEHPSVEDLLSWGHGDTVDESAPHSVLVPERVAGVVPLTVRRRRRRIAPVAAVLTVGAAAAAVLVAAWPPGDGQRSAMDPTPVTTSGSSDTSAAVRLWSPFPVDRKPRPLVLIGASILDPASGFPDGDTKEAYLDHRFEVDATFPTAPATAGGYSISDPHDAVNQLTSGGPAAAGMPLLRITQVTLAEHVFDTDRGPQTLPAWAVRIGGVSDSAFVLAVAQPDQFRWSDTDPSGPDLGAGEIAAHDNLLTFALTPSHPSTGPCDPAFTETATVRQTANVVVVAIETITVIPTTSSSATPVYCNLERQLTPSPVLIPGQPGTQTVTLTDPVGNRPIVDAAGKPWLVIAR